MKHIFFVLTFALLASFAAGASAKIVGKGEIGKPCHSDEGSDHI
jgi:hypothetical protein